MSVATMGGTNATTKHIETLEEAHYEKWNHWPVNWSAVWVGSLAALTGVLLFGLIGVAIGAHLLDPEHRVVDLKKISLWTLAFSLFSSFLAFVIGGWVAGKVAGALRSEPAILHGVIALADCGAPPGRSHGGWARAMRRRALARRPGRDQPQDASIPFSKPEPLGPSAHRGGAGAVSSRPEQISKRGEAVAGGHPEGHSQCRPGCRHGTVTGSDGQRGRRLDGLGRADDLRPSSQSPDEVGTANPYLITL